MMAKKKDPPQLDDFIAMIRDTKDEPDRGRILVLTSWLDDALDQYMRTRVVDDAKVIENLFGQDRPLGTFSARINAAYAFAYISKGIYRDLHTIREIRNDFAHERGHISFDDQRIVDKCKNLDVIQKHHAAETDPARRMTGTRGQFLLATLMYTTYFVGRTEEWQHEQFSATTEEKILIHDVIPRLIDLYEKSNA